MTEAEAHSQTNNSKAAVFLRRLSTTVVLLGLVFFGLLSGGPLSIALVGGFIMLINIVGLLEFYGMASSTALEKYYSDKKGKDYKASEGKLVKIPYKGALEDTLLDLLGGVRSTCTYIGAKKIKDILLYESGDETIKFEYLRGGKKSIIRSHSFEGVIPNLQRRYLESESAMVREELLKYQHHKSCPL